MSKILGKQEVLKFSENRKFESDKKISHIIV